MPSSPLFPPEPQTVQTPTGKGKSKAAKARKKRKAAAETASNTPAVVVDLRKPDLKPTPQELSAAPAAPANVSVVKASGTLSTILSQSLPSLSSYQNSTPPPRSPQPPEAAARAFPGADGDDGFIVVTRSKRPKNQWNHTEEEQEATKLQFWWNGGFRPPDETWDWEHGAERCTHKVETWLEALQQLTLDPPETPVIEHVVEPKQTVVPKRVLRQMAATAAQAVPKTKPQVRWGK